MMLLFNLSTLKNYDFLSDKLFLLLHTNMTNCLYPIDMGISGNLLVGINAYWDITRVFGFVLAVFSSFGITLSNKLHQIVHVPDCDGYQPEIQA